MGKKKIVMSCLALTTALSMSLVGCKNKDEVKIEEDTNVTVALTDGSYKAEANGYGGNMLVEVTVKDNKIESVEMLEHKESSPVYTRAFPVIQERIIENQSPIVDNVSGATYTSFGVKKAVGEALKEAGMDFGEIKLDTEPEREAAKELEDVNTQLVIVGAGPSGLSAAISAKESGVEDVILIEKLDILSGNGKFDMNFFDMINSEALKANDADMTVEEFIASKEKAFDSDERKTVWAEGAANLDPWLRDMGIELNFSSGGTNHMAEADEYAGEHIHDGLEKKVAELGVDVRPGTKGLDLIMEDGKVTGVKVENREGTYNINADAVIVATGGFSHNPEMLAKYAPGAEIVATSNQMGATGDFVPVFEEHDIKLEEMDVLSVFKLIIKNRRDLTGAGDGFMLVNEEGNRFAAENSSGLELAHTILEQPNGKVFYVYDQPLYESFYRLQKHNELGYHIKADTLEELAEEIGVNKDNLVLARDNFNKAINGEIQDEFRGEEMPERLFSEEGPYYGVQVESAIHMTKGGVAANEKTQVINNEDEIVDGLYASGEVTATSGAYSSSVVFGRISGEEAAKYILEK